MKINKFGFMLVETLAVSTLISVILIGLYLQFNNVISNFHQTFKYNNVDRLYATNTIKQWIKFDNEGNFYSAIKKKLESTKFIKIIVNDCNISNIEDGYLGQKYKLYACNNFKNLTDYYEVKDIIITTENISLTDDDYKALNTTEFTEINFSSSLKNFMKKIKKSETNNKYRIIVEFQNNEFATLKMEN